MSRNLIDSVRHVFLDRDGVINRKMPEGRYVASADELILLPGVASAIARLNQAGMKVIIVTNQRGVSLGLYSEEQLHTIHRHLRSLLADENAYIDAIYFCPHARDTCNCRKPLPGMFLQAFKDFPGAAPENSLLIGDSLTDIQAGVHLGIPTVLVDSDPATQALGTDRARELAMFTAPSLAAFTVDFLAAKLGG